MNQQDKRRYDILTSFDLGRIARELGEHYDNLAQVNEEATKIADAHPQIAARAAVRAERELSQMAAALGRKGGQAKSDAKVAAARENGKRGGRPPVYVGEYVIYSAEIDSDSDNSGWPIGTAGRLAEFLRAEYPRIRVTVLDGRVGCGTGLVDYYGGTETREACELEERIKADAERWLQDGENF